MNIKYDHFEILSDGAAVWRVYVVGTQHALETLEAMGKQTSNECFATDLSKREIIARVNEVST